MAKVYDALKQVEAERSRQLRAASAPVRVVPREEPKFWRRWSDRLGRNGAEVRTETTTDNGMRQHVDTILGRLDAFENLASRKIPEMERNLLQLLEARIESVEREVGASVSSLGNQMRQDVAVLNRRLSLLLGAVALLLVALILRT